MNLKCLLALAKAINYGFFVLLPPNRAVEQESTFVLSGLIVLLALEHMQVGGTDK